MNSFPFAVNSFDGDLRRGRSARALYVLREISAKRRAIEHFLLGWVDASDAENRQVRLANQRRLPPESHQLRRPAPQNVRDHHSVHAAGWRRRRNIQTGVAIHVHHADVAEIAARARNRRKCDRTIAAQNHGQRAGFYGDFDARLQRFERGDHARNIARAGTRELYFDDCAIPASRLVGDEGEGFKIALRTLDHTRITIAAQALGIAQGALDYALGYVQERKQFGRAIAEFQGLQFMIADMAMKLEAARQLTYAAAARSDRVMAGERVDDLTFFSSACKCLASDVAMSVTTDAVQLLGGYGYVNDFPVERMMRDAKITQIYEGTNQIQRMVMARQLLKD